MPRPGRGAQQLHRDGANRDVTDAISALAFNTAGVAAGNIGALCCFDEVVHEVGKERPKALRLPEIALDTKLATGSLYENICGGVELPLEKAWEAARLAALDADNSHAHRPPHSHHSDRCGISAQCPNRAARLTADPLG